MAAAASASPHPAAAADLPPPPPPLLTAAPRPRRRAREVSSRYLSTPAPALSSSAASPRLSTSSSRASSPTPSPRAHTRVATPFANENQPPPVPPSTRRRAVQKLFGEIAPNPRASVSSSSSAAAGAPPPRLLPRASSGPAPSTGRRGYPRPPTPARASSCSSAADDAASCSSTDTSSTLTDFSEPDGISLAAAPCESPPLLGPASCRGGRLSSELRSSVPESGGSTRGAAIPLCHRSLNSALSSCPAPAAKVMAAPRPPQPHGTKLAEMKKAAVVGGRKVAGKQEDVHQLRLLNNRYVQYRLLNARAAEAAKAKAAAAEVRPCYCDMMWFDLYSVTEMLIVFILLGVKNSLFGLAERMAGLRESVSDKRAKAEKIKRDQRLCSIVRAQVPYLDRWSDVEEDYSSCLTGATSALHNASLRLPIIGGVRANYEEISEVLNSAAQLLEPASPLVRNLLPKVEEVDGVASRLAQIITSERDLIEECGNLLNQAHHMQLEKPPVAVEKLKRKQRKRRK
ncbi:protein ENDOSPERM DEFECTIVE 1-like [Hordeum vulgare]|nr:protein ENDOSPERM DEFECTIVE 1-like [Hordeum vulgare]